MPTSWREYYDFRTRKSFQKRKLGQHSQGAEKFFQIWEQIQRIDASKRDLSVSADDEGGTLANAGHRRPFPENAKLARHQGVREEIGAQGKSHRTDFTLPPGNVAWNGIYADVQDLGIQCRELLAVRVEFGHLGGSSGRPIQRVKGDDEILLPQVVARADRDVLVTGDRGKGKFRTVIPHFQCHAGLIVDDCRVT